MLFQCHTKHHDTVDCSHRVSTYSYHRARADMHCSARLLLLFQKSKNSREGDHSIFVLIFLVCAKTFIYDSILF